MSSNPSPDLCQKLLALYLLPADSPPSLSWEKSFLSCSLWEAWLYACSLTSLEFPSLFLLCTLCLLCVLHTLLLTPSRMHHTLQKHLPAEQGQLLSGKAASPLHPQDFSWPRLELCSQCMQSKLQSKPFCSLLLIPTVEQNLKKKKKS